MRTPEEIQARIQAIQKAMPTANAIEYVELRGRLTEIAWITKQKVFVPERKFSSKIIKNHLAQ